MSNPIARQNTNIIIVRICSGCGEEFPKLEPQLDGKDYCSTDCFMEYNSPCEGCGKIVPNGDGVYYKEEGYTLCWNCATQPSTSST